MIRILIKLTEWFVAETPVFARFLQALSAAFAALPLYYSSLPAEFQSIVTPDELKYAVFGGGITTFLLNLLTKPSK